jgi:hypothetical protein
MEELRKARKTAVKISGTTDETGNKNLLNTSLVHYPSISLLVKREKMRKIYSPPETIPAHGLKFITRRRVFYVTNEQTLEFFSIYDYIKLVCV